MEREQKGIDHYDVDVGYKGDIGSKCFSSGRMSHPWKIILKNILGFIWREFLVRKTKLY